MGDGTGGRAGRRAAHPADRSHGPRGDRASRAPPGRRPARRGPRPHRRRRPRPRHHAHEEDGGGPDGLPPRPQHQGALHPLRHRHDRAHRDHPGPPAGRVRRPRGHQSAAGGVGYSRGLARGHPRRGQGGVSPLGAVAHPDDRARGTELRRPRPHVRRQGHRLDAEGARRDDPAARRPGRL